MTEYIERDAVLRKINKMIDHVRADGPKNYNALNVLMQCGDMIVFQPKADVVKRKDAEIQKHGPLVDLNKLKTELMNVTFSGTDAALDVFKVFQVINKAPVVIEAEGDRDD